MMEVVSKFFVFFNCDEKMLLTVAGLSTSLGETWSCSVPLGRGVSCLTMGTCSDSHRSHDDVYGRLLHS